ncbi:hypothetical protein [Actinorhabdospora filicis]|uniref:hypothetical protein n=1 Tax=Actinorhabdospora filicis TaxID=1785913 RepID=UPI0025525CB6|nr:hypothetical protein [Actinorhabdospora filicis]
MDIILLRLADGSPSCGPRTPALACADALKAGGATVRHEEAIDDAGIDAVLEEVIASNTPLVLAADTDAQVRGVWRRAVRLLAPPPSQRPDDLPAGRTVPDLPAMAILPLAQTPDLVAELGLPATPEAVAEAVLAGRTQRIDLLRHDGGSATVHGVRLGGGDTPWHGKVAVDDLILADGKQRLLTVVVANASGYASVDGLPLAEPDPLDGLLDVAVAVPVVKRGLLRNKVRVEVRRARGRAVAITPDAEIPYIDDGVIGTLARKRTWWTEKHAAAVYIGHTM